MINLLHILIYYVAEIYLYLPEDLGMVDVIKADVKTVFFVLISAKI